MSTQDTRLSYYNNPINFTPGKKTNMGPPAPMPSMSQMPSMGNFNPGMGLVRSNAFGGPKGGKYGRRTRHRRRHAKKSMRRMRVRSSRRR